MQLNVFDKTPEEEVEIFFQQLKKAAAQGFGCYYRIICNAKNISFLYYSPLGSEKYIFTKDFKILGNYAEVKENAIDSTNFIIECIKEDYFVELVKCPYGVYSYNFKEERVYPCD